MILYFDRFLMIAGADFLLCFGGPLTMGKAHGREAGRALLCPIRLAGCIMNVKKNLLATIGDVSPEPVPAKVEEEVVG